MEVKVFDKSGKATSKSVKLEDSIFAVEPNDHAIYLDVKQHLANKRQGTHKSKERADIVGSTRKIKKQKGTGTARAGPIKSPVFRGGGRVFGPRPRNYSFKLNKKLKRVARKSALSYKAQESNIMVIEDFNFEAPKTKDFINLISNMNLSNEKVLLVVSNENNNVYMASRNLSRTKVIAAESVNTYDVLNAGKVIIAKSSIEIIEKALN
jgi:large subunit ribosomal protein L4